MSHILLTGSTGMVGKGILLECLKDPKITSVTLLNRSSLGMDNPKIKEVLLKDFMELEKVKNELGKPDACFHCMGVSAMGLNEEQYSHFTFDITKKLADLSFELNPSMTFNYVSGQGTDSSEKGRIMWARVKGRAENYILEKGFKNAFMFRPGIILPENGLKSKVKTYNVLYTIMRPFFPLLRKMKSVTTTTKVAKAMINTLKNNNVIKTHLENVEINKLSTL